MTRAFILTFVLSVPLAGHGQQPQESFNTCLSDSTSGKDRKDLAKWVFLAMAAHPELRNQLAPGTATAMEESSKRVAELIVRLLAQDCVQQTKAILKGSPTSQTFEAAFSRLGQLAMQELMTEQSVQAAMGQFEKYLDKKRLDDALIGK
jgi:hypothetical protein